MKGKRRKPFVGNSRCLGRCVRRAVLRALGGWSKDRPVGDVSELFRERRRSSRRGRGCSSWRRGGRRRGLGWRGRSRCYTRPERERFGGRRRLRRQRRWGRRCWGRRRRWGRWRCWGRWCRLGLILAWRRQRRHTGLRTGVGFDRICVGHMALRRLLFRSDGKRRGLLGPVLPRGLGRLEQLRLARRAARLFVLRGVQTPRAPRRGRYRRRCCTLDHIEERHFRWCIGILGFARRRIRRRALPSRLQRACARRLGRLGPCG